jgi:hypothetical protein
MGVVLPFKVCTWSGNGFCIATSIDACVCYRGGSSKMLTALGRAPKALPKPMLKVLPKPDISISIPIHEVSAKECPPPWSAPQAGMGDLDDGDVGC